LLDFNDVVASPVRYDLDEIVHRLRITAESWVPRHFPNGRRLGDEWRLANIQGAPPRNTGSCVITLAGEHAGNWHEFDGGQGGGPLSTLEQALRLDGTALFAEAARLTGWSAAAPAREAPPASTAAKRDPGQEIAFILTHAMAIPGTVAARYLESRSLVVPPPADLRCHPDLTHYESRMGYPALVGIVRDRDGEVVALHRTYLEATADGVAKAAIARPRMMLGKVAGGAVRLAEIGADGLLGLCEGIETGLAVMTACPELPVWATLSTQHLEQVQLPMAARIVLILADHDGSGAGLRSAEATAARLRAEGRHVVIVAPPEVGQDFNDLLLGAGLDSIRDAIKTAWRQQPAAPEPEPAARGRHLPIGFVQPAEAPPALRADEGDLDRAAARAWQLLLAANDQPWLFRVAGLPGWIVPDDDGRPVAAVLTEERLRLMLAKLALWRRLARNGDLVPAHPPTPVIKCVLATPDPDLPILTGIVTAPVFGRGGALLTSPGYHPDARLYYHAMPGFDLPPIAVQPTAAEITAARQLILDDLFGDFPFTGHAERAHAVALLLLGFLRAMIDGPTPLHMIEKPTPGTGATLLVDAVATIQTGSGAAVTTEGRDDEEWRKRITAKLRQIPAIVLIDNLRHELDSSALAAALTAPYWEDRILGVSEMTRLPIRAVWIATGNNPSFSNEMARRIVRIRLDARVDQPWRRDGFRHADLMGWVRANRARLVAACLTLCQAWIAPGRPRGSHSLGSYDAWAQTMGGVLKVAGIEGFLGNLDEMLEAADGESAVWRSFVGSWWDRFGTAEVGTGNLFDLTLSSELPLPLGTGNEQSRRTRLGIALGKLRDRVFRVGRLTVQVKHVGTSQGAQRWSLAIDENTGTAERSQRSPISPGLVTLVTVGDRCDSNGHEKTSQQFNGLNEFRDPCDPCDRFPTPYACAGAHAPARENQEKRSQGSQRSPDPATARDSTRDRCGERSPACLQRSPGPTQPAWLEDVP
jgi:hypothetical protein